MFLDLRLQLSQAFGPDRFRKSVNRETRALVRNCVRALIDVRRKLKRAGAQIAAADEPQSRMAIAQGLTKCSMVLFEVAASLLQGDDMPAKATAAHHTLEAGLEHAQAGPSGA